MFAPFIIGLAALLSGSIITGNGRFRKCAILVFLGPFQGLHGDADLPESHLGNVADRAAQDGGYVRGIEVPDMAEVQFVHVDRRVIAAASQQHIQDAAFHGALELQLRVLLVQFFQEAVRLVQHQVPEVVGVVVLHQHVRDGFQIFREGLHLLSGNVEGVRQGLHHGFLVPELHLPELDGAARVAVGVRQVEHIAEPVAGGAHVQQGDTLGALVDPAAQAVPDVDPGTGNGVRLLLKDQELLLEVVLVVAGSGPKESKIGRLGGQDLRLHLIRQVPHDLVFAWHIVPPLRV